jgi:hypothetical protein
LRCGIHWEVKATITNYTMKRLQLLAAIILLVCAVPLQAQKHIAFKLVQQFEFPFNTEVNGDKFGGISAIQFFNKDSIVLVSDHNADGFSYAFTMNSAYKLLHAKKFYGVESVECIRYSNHLHKLFYAYEKYKTTGVGYIEDGKPIDFFTEAIPSENTSNNRGIEGITFTSDNSLWVAFEAGGSKTCESSTIPFYRFSLQNGKYSADRKTVYEYPFSRCSCSNGKFNGSFGNGVSEILAFNSDANKILVLERCFSGFSANLKLYLATVPKEGKLLQKELVFDFNANATFDKQNKNYSPDNLEAMTWGEMENGMRTLYIASDNNFNILQRNQVVKLVEE